MDQADDHSDSKSGNMPDSAPSKFHVDMGLIPSANFTDDMEDLKGLDIGVFNQDDLEQGMYYLARNIYYLLSVLLSVNNCEKLLPRGFVIIYN